MYLARLMEDLGINSILVSLMLQYDPYTNLPKDAAGRLRHIDVDFVETYKAVEALVDRGLVRSIGLCNFNIGQMRRILAACEIRPQVLQVESNPRFHNDILRYFLHITLY